MKELYNKDKYHIEFVDKLGEIVPKDLLNLYNKILELSLEAPFDEELNDSYQLSLELLCKGLGIELDISSNVNSKEEL